MFSNSDLGVNIDVDVTSDWPVLREASNAVGIPGETINAKS